MHAANNKGIINIIRATLIRFTGRSPEGDTLTTKQMVYITDQSDKLILSRKACIALK